LTQDSIKFADLLQGRHAVSHQTAGREEVAHLQSQAMEDPLPDQSDLSILQGKTTT
jgi:hypothetical protein